MTGLSTAIGPACILKLQIPKGFALWHLYALPTMRLDGLLYTISQYVSNAKVSKIAAK